MKNLTKSIFALLAVAFALSFTSCLKSDDDYQDNSIKPEDYALYLNKVTGAYGGKMKFLNDTISKNNKVDSIATRVQVLGVDTTIHVTIPANLMLKSVRSNDDLKEAMSDMDIDIKMHFYLYAVQDNVLYFGVYPEDIVKEVTFGGKTHKVQFCFFNNILNYWGAYYNNRLQIQMCLSRIYLDNNTIRAFDLVGSAPEDASIYLFVLDKYF